MSSFGEGCIANEVVIQATFVLRKPTAEAARGSR